MRKWFLLMLLLVSLPLHAAPPAPFGDGSWRTLLQAHAGKPVVVHFWGVTCAPCQAELPEWGRLLHERPALPLVLIEADAAPVKAERIASLLTQAGLSRTESWVLDSIDERRRYQIDPDWEGEMPLTLLIGRDGTITRIVGSADFNIVRQWLDHEAPERL